MDQDKLSEVQLFKVPPDKVKSVVLRPQAIHSPPSRISGLVKEENRNTQRISSQLLAQANTENIFFLTSLC